MAGEIGTTTQARLKELFELKPCGALIRKVKKGNQAAGNEVNPDIHGRMAVDGVMYRAVDIINCIETGDEDFTGYRLRVITKAEREPKPVDMSFLRASRAQKESHHYTRFAFFLMKKHYLDNIHTIQNVIGKALCRNPARELSLTTQREDVDCQKCRNLLTEEMKSHIYWLENETNMGSAEIEVEVKGFKERMSKLGYEL